jgi:O-antigen/teichoic acid export membrane protein
MIVRVYGTATFGEYSLVFGILTVAEWVADFGTNEVFVREVCREPARRGPLLRILTAAKLLQVPAAYAVLAGILLALRYPREIVEAGLLGGLAMVFYGGVLVYRVVFRADLAFEREVMAELVSVLAMIPLIALASSQGAGLRVLVACHVVSRAVFFALCYFLGRGAHHLSVAGVASKDVRWAFQSAAAMGVIGFLVGIYEAADILLLSKLDFAGVAYYAGAQRIVWPLLMALASVGATLYPVLSSYWPREPRDFERALQNGIHAVVLLAGVALSSLLAGAEFFMGLLGRELVTGAPALRVLAVLCFVKAITSTLGPVLYVVHAQRQALRFIVVALVAKVIVAALLASWYGYMGVAVGALLVEVCFAAVPPVFLLRRFTGYRVKWRVPLLVAATASAAGGVPWLFGWAGSFLAAVMAPALFVALAFASGAVHLEELRPLLKRRVA